MQIKEVNREAVIRGMNTSGKRAERNREERTKEESFQNSLKKSMGQEEPEKASGAKGKEKEQSGGKVLLQGKGENITIRAEQGRNEKTVTEVPVRHLPYGESDGIEINVLGGYTLKAKLEDKGEKDGQKVYVEVKRDDGETKAYVFHRSELHKDSTDPIEHFAYEVMKQNFE